MKLSRRRFLGKSALVTAVAIPALARASALIAPAKNKMLAKARAAAPLPANALRQVALSRFAYGPTAEALDRYASLGPSDSARFDAWIERQLDPRAIDDKACEARLASLGLETLQKPLPRLWADHGLAEAKESKGPPPEGAAKAQKKDANELRQQPAMETEIAAWTRAVYSERQLFETVVEFWHDHFNVMAYDGNNIPPVFAHYDRDVIRARALGNFRQLLEEVAKSPAMLFYLDNFVNQSANPNENYGRELLELHTLGAEHYAGVEDRARIAGFASGLPVGYVDGDVYETARCFTGWRVDIGKNSGETGQFTYQDQNHDRFQKIVLGRSLPELAPPLKDAQRALDILCDHPATAAHLALKLCRRFVSDRPPERLLKATAAAFRESRSAPDQIARVIRSIARSPEFAASSGAKFKRPFEFTASLLRATRADFVPSRAFLGAYNRMGQRRFAWRTPDGYPEARERWGGSANWLERWRLANQIALGHLDGAAIDLASLLPIGIPRGPRALAESASQAMLGGPMPEAELREVVEALAQGRDPVQPLPEPMLKNRAPNAIALIAMAPSFQKR